MAYHFYPIDATDPGSRVRDPRTIINHKVDVTRTHYRIVFKFWQNVGIFRVNGFGPFTECNRSNIRKVFTIFTDKKAPKNWHDLMDAFAEYGFTVTEISKDYKLTPIVW